LFSKTILFLILHSRGLPAITWQPRLALPFGYPSTSRPVSGVELQGERSGTA